MTAPGTRPVSYTHLDVYKRQEFNMDTGCVELRFQDGSMISIDCTAVENEVADNLYERSELDLSLIHI